MVAEIAAELRVNPAKIRLWVSKGKLKAMRAGQRKLLVQRSELNRMLEASSHRYDDVPAASQSAGYPRTAALCAFGRGRRTGLQPRCHPRSGATR